MSATEARLTEAEWDDIRSENQDDLSGECKAAIERVLTNRLVLGADECCTCHTGDDEHDHWCVALGVLSVLLPREEDDR